ncbi:hypothetical protein B566_EDAN005044 [Ephemera danica]|nr:hypothetical protein B566_EDAN005044 [Ephemera danica]
MTTMEDGTKSQRRSDFSIARILGQDHHVIPLQQREQRFEWLQCTRYRPPRLPRSRRREGAQRRKLGRNPRIPFSSAQVSVLEQRFRRGHYLSSADVAELASFLALSETRVKIWFQNRRARERRDREAQQNCHSPLSAGDSPPHHASVSLQGRAISQHRSLPGTTTSFTGISRTQIAALAMSRSSAGPSAFAPVCPLAFLATNVATTVLNLTATAQYILFMF